MQTLLPPLVYFIYCMFIFQQQKLGETGSMEDEGVELDNPLTPPLYYQNLLMQFLGTKAPLLDENPTADNRTAFNNLILLFCELIHHEVFSHDIYMSTLISRGDLLLAPAMHAAKDTGFHGDLSSVKSQSSMRPDVSNGSIYLHFIHDYGDYSFLFLWFLFEYHLAFVCSKIRPVTLFF